MKNPNVSSLAGTLLACAVAVPLAYSGLVHANNPFAFASGIAAYGLLPSWAITALAFFAPYLFLAVAGSLVFEKTRYPAAIFAMLLYAIFLSFQVTAIISDKNIDCGCFGSGGHVVSAKTAAIPATAFVLSCVLYAVETYATRKVKENGDRALGAA